MNYRTLLQRVAGLAWVAAIAVTPATATAGPPPGVDDPHRPDITKGFCPGGRFGFGRLGVCDGDKYPDGSYWHQWLTQYITGPQFYYDCVGGDEPLPGPPPPGGCEGAAPPGAPGPPGADQPPPPTN